MHWQLCYDPQNPAALLSFQMMIPELCSRPRRTTSTPATSRWTSLLWNCASSLCLTFNLNSSCSWCVCVSVCLCCLSGGAPSVWCAFTLCCSSGSFATDLHSLLADCLGATDTHHHHAYNSDRKGTGIHILILSICTQPQEWTWVNREANTRVFNAVFNKILYHSGCCSSRLLHAVSCFIRLL